MFSPLDMNINQGYVLHLSRQSHLGMGQYLLNYTIIVPYYIHLVGGWATPLKNMSSSIGMISNPIYGKIKLMFQTTNQPCVFSFSWFFFMTLHLQLRKALWIQGRVIAMPCSSIFRGNRRVAAPWICNFPKVQLPTDHVLLWRVIAVFLDGIPTQNAWRLWFYVTNGLVVQGGSGVSPKVLMFVDINTVCTFCMYIGGYIHNILQHIWYLRP